MEENKQVPAKDLTWWQITLVMSALALWLFLMWIIVGVGVPNRMYKMYYITSGSMAPVIQAGDLVCVTPIKEDVVLQANDIITFTNNIGQRVTHRIVEIQTDGTIVTKGDANNANDTWEDGFKLKREKVLGLYSSRIPKLGFAVCWFQGLFHANGSTAQFHDKATIKNNVVGIAPETIPPASPNLDAPAYVPESSALPSEKPSQPMEPTPSPSDPSLTIGPTQSTDTLTPEPSPSPPVFTESDGIEPTPSQSNSPDAPTQSPDPATGSTPSMTGSPQPMETPDIVQISSPTEPSASATTSAQPTETPDIAATPKPVENRGTDSPGPVERDVITTILQSVTSEHGKLLFSP